MRWTVYTARTGDIRSVYKILIGKPEGKRTLERPRRKWEDNIRMDLKAIGVDWIHLAQDMNHWRTVVNTVIKLQVI
jgi:hypothetical protein